VPSASSATNAGKLDGIDSTGFVKGSGVKVYQGKAIGLTSTSGSNQATLLTLAGLGGLDVVCNGDQLSWVFTDTTNTTEQGSTVSGDNVSFSAQYWSGVLTPNTIGNTFTFFHDNHGAPNSPFQDDIAIENLDSHHTSARIQLNGVTDVGGNSTCNAYAVATVH
jgi:hypothetical protein